MPRTSPHPTTEACQALPLDTNAVMHPAAAALRDARRRGAEGAVEVGLRTSWTGRGAAAPWAWVDIAVRLDQGPAPGADVLLHYAADHADHPTGRRVQRVAVAAVPCHFGGVRWAWICPATGRNARFLYLPCGGTRFLSRRAYRLRWASTCSTPLEKSHLRLRRLARKLDGEYQGFTYEPPPKPKRMRWATYDRLAAAWEAAARRHDAAWSAGARRTLRRLGAG
jgi:hypothetical protein